jgi:glycosyltransferase involved in cell wall biosynthesis
MRIVVDLQACQGQSAFRGIGRYSMSLAQAMVEQAVDRNHEVWLVLSDALPDSVLRIREIFTSLIPQEQIIALPVSGPIAQQHKGNEWRARMAELLRTEIISRIQPDILHTASVVEDWLDDLLGVDSLAGVQFNSAATFYDLIPFNHPNLYLVDAAYREYYYRKVDSFKGMDLLLAISDSSRNEAIDMLGIDSDRIVNISAAVDSSFKPITYTKDQQLIFLSKYQITKPFILYVPGGFDPRKNFERLFEAFAGLSKRVRSAHQLVIASHIPEGMSDVIQEKVSKAGLSQDEVILTGYVPDEELVTLYNLCELKIFPSIHEGFGLPVLEAMACGAPVIGSNTTSIPEVIGCDDALFDPLCVTSISSKMQQCLTDENFIKALRVRAKQQASKFSWNRSASIALDAFELCHIEKNTKDIIHPMNTSESMADCCSKFMSKVNDLDLDTSHNEKDLENFKRTFKLSLQALPKRQMLIDISTLVETDAKTGIQRVVRSILIELINNPPEGFRIEPVYYINGDSFYYARDFMVEFLGTGREGNNDNAITYKNGDVFIGLDLTAHLFPAINPTLQDFKDNGVEINYVVYDLTPLQDRGWHTVEMAAAFTAWMASLCNYADRLICISDSVAFDVKQWINLNSKESYSTPKVEYFHLGADIAASLPTKGLPLDASEVLSRLELTPSLLMVGTIEPRKGVSQVLSAFEQLWSNGTDANLVLVGKEGWHMEELAQVIREHTEFNKRLVWLEGISDEYLEKVYHSSAALIAASEAEGFGLPLIEAAKFGTPIIARDIAVFKEVAGQHAFYFDGTGAGVLADSINEWLELYSNNIAPSSEGVKWLTWKESTQDLLSAVFS